MCVCVCVCVLIPGNSKNHHLDLQSIYIVLGFLVDLEMI